MSTQIDTRELNDRLEELEALRDALDAAKESLAEAVTDEEKEAAESEVESATLEFGTDEQAELKEIEELRDETDSREFRHGIQLIPCDEFEDYARQLAEDIGAIPDNAQWPCTCIDWEQAAKELAADYSVVTFQGSDYYFRA